MYMKEITTVLIGFIILFIFSSCATNENSGVHIQYPEPSPETSPLIFLPGVVSKEGLDFNSAISPDGRSFYFSRSQRGQWDIFVSTHDGKNWAEPVLASFSDPRYSEADPAFSPDGKLYYISNRPKHEMDTLSDFDIWFSEPSSDGQWSAPENLVPINSDSAEYYISFARNGNAYFGSSRKGGFGGEDIYVSRMVNGEYTMPENLGSAINTKESEHDPCIWPNEERLVFKSENREDGFGQADLYVARLTNEKTWTQATNLGSKFNTHTYEYCPYLTPDARYFFYSSEFDIKWINAEALEMHIDSLISK